MMKNKIFALCAAVLCFSGTPAETQQLTRFAVVDLSKVYLAFFRESQAVREFEDQRDRVQSEIDRMTREIQALKTAQLNAEAQGDRSQAVRLENEVYRNSEYLKEYFRLKTAELEDRKQKLTQSETFLGQVYDEIRAIAESEGYSMVLNLKENTGILWFSPTVDITDKLIQNMRAKGSRR
ncbi:MAG: OmpH family outer membrane protein [Spirochaetaceae bacterium]|jgi:outer membrane protein|nr:OmpH family outer membrane protein [Spirochaetaceae bacterium]